jgi:putative transferase (TIGR04331 family)
MIELLKSSEKKKYLITNFQKLEYPAGSELVFIDETLLNFYSPADRLLFKCSYLNSIDDVIKNINSNNIIIKKKLSIYRKELTKILNAYNKINNSEKYWGVIIDNFLITLLQPLIKQIKLFKKIRLKNFNIINEVIKENTFIKFNNFQLFTFSNDFRKLLCSLVLKELDHKSINLKYLRSSNKINVRSRTALSKLILIPIIRLYVFFFKPILIVNGYIGLKNTINFFFRSFGKIINIPNNFFFNEVDNNFSMDRNFRQRIKIREKDIIDKIFNKIVGKLLPVNYLENFNSIKQDVKKISEKIKVIGTGNCHYISDNFNILTAEILNNKNKKLIIFQHGGTISKSNQLDVEYIDQKYSSRCYYFDDQKGLGMHFLNEKKISFEEIKKRNSILILNAFAILPNYLPPARVLYSINDDPSLVFFSKLNESNKKKVLVKLHPEKKSLIVKNLWKKNFQNKINFLPIFSNAKKERYFNAKLVILNDVSTPLWELLFFGLPFILVCSKKFLDSLQYKDSFKKKFIRLNKVNIWFKDPEHAAEFVNSLDKDYLIEEWWKKISKTKIFLDFKNYLIVEKDNYLPRIVKELKNLNK